MKTTVSFLDRLEYRRTDDGGWKTEFHGAVHVEAERPSLELCRFRAREALGDKLSAWLAGGADSDNGISSQR